MDVPFRDLTFGGVPDPRVTVIDLGTTGADNATEIFAPAKYPSIDAPIVVGKWEEAQLILAEADLAAGDVGGAVSIINTLHTNAGLPAYGGGTPEEVLAQIIDERRRELFLEGQRLGDIIRYGVPLYPAPGTPFAVGAGNVGRVWNSGVLPASDGGAKQQSEYPGLNVGRNGGTTERGRGRLSRRVSEQGSEELRSSVRE